MGLTKKEHPRRIFPREELMEKLRPIIGHKVTPYAGTLELILKDWGFNLPGFEEINGDVYYGFHATVNSKTYTKLSMEYVDALAEEIIFVTEHKMI